ncbi:MAG: ABC transporter permease [Actinomycetota bacterium]|nr:ABC transporter permease [Actinomycetota bacterium]
MNKLIRAEWIKWATIRMNWIIAIVGIVLGVALTGVIVGLYDPSPDVSAAEELASRVELIGAGSVFFGIFAGILGVRVFGNEYRTNTMMPSVIAAPIRTEVVAAKGILTFIVGLVYAIIGGALSVAVVMVGLEMQDLGISFGDENMTRIALGHVAYTVVYALVGTAVGALFTSPALGIALIIAFPSVVEGALGGFLPGNVGRYLPFTAGNAIIESTPEGPTALEGALIFGGFTFVLFLVGGAVFERRDLG